MGILACQSEIEISQFNSKCEIIKTQILPVIRKELKGIGKDFVAETIGTSVTIGFSEVMPDECVQISKFITNLRETLEVLYKKNKLELKKIFRSTRCEKCVWRIECT